MSNATAESDADATLGRPSFHQDVKYASAPGPYEWPNQDMEELPGEPSMMAAELPGSLPEDRSMDEWG
jgi:hypothetical protein